ncbi:MAG: sensor histidine kinase, partial [Longimicrobiales bacterium]
MLGRRATTQAQREMATPSAVRILLDPAEAQADKDRRARHLNAVVYPATRMVGVQVLIGLVLLHNFVVQSDFAFRDHLWFIAVVEAYALLSWLVLHFCYGRTTVDLGYWSLFADLVPFTLTVYATGGPASWVYAILLIRVADQTSAGYRRALVFAHVVPLIYLALVLYMGLVEGRSFSWPLELAKPVFLYCFAIYLSTTAKGAEAVRERMVVAVRVARDSIHALEDKGRELEEQSRQLEAARRKAEEASAAKSAFLSRASHELRTPLNAVLGFAQLLELERLDPEHRSQVAQIVSGGVLLRELLDDLLDLTGIESGHLPVATAPTLLGPVVHEVLAMLRPHAEEQGVKLRTEIEPGDDRALLADRRRLKQVLLNLVTNAIKYNRLGGWVSIHCETVAAERRRIVVKDSGAGIPGEKLAQLYRPFDRLGAEQSGVEGTGLGLALSKALLAAMGGDIGVDSELGRGSTFWIDLPAAGTPVAATTHVAPTDVEPVEHHGDATILY